MPEDPRFYHRVPRQVEEAGFDLLFTGDHMFAKGPNAEALTLLAACTAVTERVVLGTAVLLLPLRDPVLAAKQAAMVDLLSGGRFVLGVGVGGEFDWEWRAMGVPVEGRGTRVDEWLELMGALWTGEPVEHPGPLRPVTGVRGSPLPARPGGPPVWVGGRSAAALARAARHDGWCAYSVSPRRTRASVDRLTELRGGDLEHFRVSAVVFVSVSDDEKKARQTAARVLSNRYSQDFDRFLDAFAAVGRPEQVLERIEAFREAGVDDILLSPQVPAEEFEEQIDVLATLLERRPVDGTRR
ncbi:MAG: hypothetical protein QOG64_1793 [Acidimicrobiaceae bacterium]|nr:hypothetical protein [Acidimicrobiaceae bacterium]